MTKESEGRSGVTAGVLLAASVGLLALPSTVLAFTANFATNEAAVAPAPVGQSSAPSPTHLAHALSIGSLAKGRLFLFTPAGTPTRPNRSVTVAVRVDAAAAQAITVRGRQDLAQADGDLGNLRISQTAFNLGVSRGYRNFAQDPAPSARGIADLPDIRKYSLAPSDKQPSSRFSSRVSIDERAAAGRAPRTFSGDASEVDLSGAYKVTKNLDVTAGVRYSQERERLTPLTDGRQDSQAVYVGTQFKF